jgi:hypothetical protein
LVFLRIFQLPKVTAAVIWYVRKLKSRIRMRLRLTEDEHGVVDEEVLHRPRPEGRVTVEEDDEDHPSLADVSLQDDQFTYFEE